MDYNKVWSVINKADKSKRSVALMVGMSAQGFDTMMKNKTMTVEVLEKISNYFNKPISYFFDTEVTQVNESAFGYNVTGCKLCEEKEKRITDLTERIKDLRDHIETLKSDHGKKSPARSA